MKSVSPKLARWLIPTLIIVLTAVAFLPVLQNEFVVYDDESNLLANPLYRGLRWKQISWMFTSFHMTNYRPLTWLTLGLDYTLWGMDPFGYHLTSFILHLANASLFYLFSLSLLSLALPSCEVMKLRLGAGFAALVFAIHPLRVEAVAWASARNDVLSGFFFILTLVCYLRAVQGGASQSARWRWLSVSVFLYALSLLSKGTGMTLPVVLLALDVYPLCRLGGGRGRWFGQDVRSIWWEKFPFALLALAAGVLAVIGKGRDGGSLIPLGDFGPFERLLQAAYGFVFYLWKTVVPVGLSPLYELPVGFNPWQWSFLASGVIVLAASVVFISARRRFRAGLTAWTCYLAILAPVSGLIQYGPQIVADRYSYLACLGWSVLAGAGLVHWLNSWRKGFVGMLARGLTIGVILGLGFLTWKQTQVWRGTETLWRHALAIDPLSRYAHNNLGIFLMVRGEGDEAISHFRQVIAIDSFNTTAFYNLGNALARKGDLAEAVRYFRQAVTIDPSYAAAYYNLGSVLAAQGKMDEAIEEYRQAVRNDSTHVKAHFYLGEALASRGDLDEAIFHFREAVRLEQNFVEAHESLAKALAAQGKKKEAVEQYQEALRMLKSRLESGTAH